MPASKMVEVSFQPMGVTTRVQPGLTILAASETAGVEIVTGCTQGMCGTDPVRIIQGQEGLSEPEEHEKGTLERMGLGADFRLSCSARVLAGSILVQTDAF